MRKWYHPSSVMPDKPWLHESAIQYLDSILESDMNICEFGGGGSTLWFSERVKGVYTYENNPTWMTKLREIKNDNVYLFEEDISQVRFTGVPFDLVFIDGEPVGKRRDWLNIAPHISSTWVVLDNANRPEFAKERALLREYAELWNVINGNEPGTLYLVTEFWRIK